jgi:hypothetical protein
VYFLKIGVFLELIEVGIGCFEALGAWLSLDLMRVGL